MTAVFNTKFAEDYDRNGSTVTIIAESRIKDTIMYAVRFPDGEERVVYAQELSNFED